MPESYDRAFFEEQRQQGLRSARVVAPLVVEMLQPKSVVDVGCGGGAWLAAFKECGVSDTLGIDGAWAKAFNELSSSEFMVHDLSTPIRLERRFDLVVSLEVAEHLPSTSAPAFVESLTSLGDVVLFSAAVPFQGGTLHLNEQWQDYWAALFDARGFRAIDAIRPRIWSEQTVDWWYAQNAMLFVAARQMASPPFADCRPIDQLSALRVVHPRHFIEKAHLANIGLEEALTMIPALARAAAARRARRVLEWFTGRART